MVGRKKIIEPGLAWGLAAIFFYAGSRKFLQPAAFLVDVQSFHLLPRALSDGVAYYLPALEIAAAAGMGWPRFRQEACVILAVLTLVFIVALSSAWVRGLDISCGCFGKSNILANYPLLIGRNLLILFGCGLVFALRTKAPGQKARGLSERCSHSKK